MSRTRRVGPAEGFWPTVDAWAAAVVERSPVRAWWSSRARLVGRSGPYLDLLEPLPAAAGRRRPLARPAGAEGVAYAADDDLRAVLERHGVAHRRVEAARRYRWNGPALTPVVLEAHEADGEAVLEAWWEDVWVAWPTIRLGREAIADRPPRRAAAVAQITRLFADLGHEPLPRPDG